MRLLGLGTLALILTVGFTSVVAARERPVGADHRLALVADTGDTGYVGLRLHGAAGLAVTIDEAVEGGTPERIRELTMDEPDVRIRRATRWRCDRRTRTFVVSAADGRGATASIRTPSCERRLALAAPRRAREGGTVRYRVLDRCGSEGCARGSASSPPAVRPAASGAEWAPGACGDASGPASRRLVLQREPLQQVAPVLRRPRALRPGRQGREAHVHAVPLKQRQRLGAHGVKRNVATSPSWMG